jgi:glycosyltransferase involved in cell wall biosynthesis
VFPRNGANLFLERECSDYDGYFDQMWNVHFPAGGRGALDLSPRHHLVDFDVPLPGPLSRLRLTATVLREVLFLGWALVFARRHGVSLLEATNPYLQGLNAFLLGKLLGLPYAVLITSDYDWFWRVIGKQAFPSLFPSRKAEKAVERVVLSSAALAIGDRQLYRDYAVRNGTPAQRAVATRVLADSVYEAVDSTAATAARAQETVRPLLTYVGRLAPEKRPLDLVDCLAHVRERYPTARLVCAGEGPLAEAMRQRALERGVADGLELRGNLGLDLLANLLAATDVVVAAHMGYTLIEAGLTGVPIVTYDYDWHGEIIEDGVSGGLAPFGDTRALADRVCHFLADPDFAARAGALVRDRLLREHARSAVIPLYRAAYDAVLGPADRPEGTLQA